MLHLNIFMQISVFFLFFKLLTTIRDYFKEMELFTVIIYKVAKSRW